MQSRFDERSAKRSQENRHIREWLVSTWYQAASRGDFGSRGQSGGNGEEEKKSGDANLSHRVEGWKLCANAIPFSQVSWKTVQGARPNPRVHDWRNTGQGMLPISRPEAVFDVAARGSSLFRDIRSVGNIWTYCTALDSLCHFYSLFTNDHSHRLGGAIMKSTLGWDMYFFYFVQGFWLLRGFFYSLLRTKWFFRGQRRLVRLFE